MKKATINNVSLCFRDIGDGMPVVFLHAFPLNQSLWDDQAAVFSDSFRIITFDWRGFGESSLSEDVPSSMDVFADDVAGLLDHLGIDRAVICGISMGGYAALGLLRRYPEIISALALVDSRAKADTDEARQNRLTMARVAREEGTKAIADAMLPKLLGKKTIETKPDVVSRVRAMIEANGGEGVARALLGMAERPDSTSLLEKIECATLVVVGEDDVLTLPSEAEAMAKAIPGAALEIIPGAGHLSNLEQPHEFNRILRFFLSSLK